ncbi:MAG: hypothetical protein EP305_02460 [Bacteroidetes bacterium]|nr:MAG: hypothetical protein EP305_02460 [Bacteroidota bacterium]
MIRTAGIFVLSFLIVMPLCYSQDSITERKTKKIKILPVPALGYSPETKFYFGAVALFQMNFYQDSLTRTSNAKVELNYTMRKQFIAEAEWNYFFKEEKWFTNGILHFSKFPDLYYGIGPNTINTNELNYQSNRAKIDLNLLRQVSKGHFLGGGLKYVDYWDVASLTDMIIPFQELIDARALGLQLQYLIDKRNSILTPTNGYYMRFYNAELSTANGVYAQFSLDLRKYHTLGKKKNHTFSGRAYTVLNTSNAPFFDIALLGGDKLVRGYYFGRFRDLSLSTVQMEYRYTLYKWFGLSGFAGISTLYHNTETFGTYIRPNAGVGLRIKVDKNENTNLRFDYAIGNDGQSGFYVSFGESF